MVRLGERRVGRAIVLAGCLLAATLPARLAVGAGADVDAATRAAARTLGYAGVEAYERADYATASAKLEKAYSALRVPSLGLWSARALEKQGRLVEASERYRQIAKLEITSGEEAVQRKAQEDAAKQLNALLPRIPVLVVKVDGAPPSEVRILLDGTEFPPSLVDEPRPIDPGEHRLVARWRDRSVQETVVAEESKSQEIVLQLRASTGPDTRTPRPEEAGPKRPLTAAGAPVGPPAPGAPLSTPTEPPRATASPPSHQGNLQRNLGWISLGVGGAAVVTGAVTGLVAIQKKSEIDGNSNCNRDTNQCLTSQADTVNPYNTLRTVSTTAFVAGGVLAAAGAALLFTSKSAGERVAVSVGPTGVVVRSTF